jgi:hypothetical protein
MKDKLPTKPVTKLSQEERKKLIMLINESKHKS